MWKLNRLGEFFSEPVWFSILADWPSGAVGDSSNEHETSHHEPGNREGNMGHVVVLSVLGPCSEELRPFSARFPERNARKVEFVGGAGLTEAGPVVVQATPA